MWSSRSEPLAEGRVTKFAIDEGSVPVSYGAVLERWQNDADFRSWFTRLLAQGPYAAFRWETPALALATANRPFEFVLLDSPGLARTPDAEAFADHFDGAPEKGVVEFANIGKDAILVVPCPRGPHSAYGHFGAFVREAPESQQHALWETVGAAVQRRLSKKPVWLSTAGAGVAWLHVRLDDRPKYYGHAAYR
jgi:hypothetical protein